MPASIFISYRRNDTGGACDLIEQALTQAYGKHTVFRDVHAIYPGVTFETAIKRGIAQCDIVLVLIGPSWVHVTDETGKRRLDDHDDMVRFEVREALSLHKVVIPVLVAGATMPRRNELPADISDLTRWNALKLETHDREALHSLVEVVRFHRRELNPTSVQHLSEGRRLIVYILLDCSEDNRGEPIAAYQEVIMFLRSTLAEDPNRLDIWIRIICFGDTVSESRLLPVDHVVMPRLPSGGKRVLGLALNRLVADIQADVTQNTPSAWGDYCPIVFLLISGSPTGSYKGELAKLKALRGSRRPTVVALGIGAGVDHGLLRELAVHAHHMNDATMELFKQYIVFIDGEIPATTEGD